MLPLPMASVLFVERERVEIVLFLVKIRGDDRPKINFSAHFLAEHANYWDITE